MEELSQHERDILRFIERYKKKHGISPTNEEIRIGVGLKSKDHVHRELRKLQRRGFLQIKPIVSRGIIMIKTADGYPIEADAISIPLWGVITAGNPIPLPDPTLPPLSWITITRAMIPNLENIYALRVRGTSMIDALINDGDIVILQKQETAQNGDLVAARLWKDPTNPETTLKRFFRNRNRDQIELRPENPEYQTITAKPDEVEIQGKVIYVMRDTSRSGKSTLRVD